MFTMKRIAASVGAAFALGVAPLASAAIDPVSAIADGTLKFTNFKFTTGGAALCQFDPAVTPNGLCRSDTIGSIFILNGGETADSSVSLNGTALPQVPASSPLGGSFIAASGLGPSYVAPTLPALTTADLGSQNGTANLTTGTVTQRVSGGTSWSAGNSLTGSANVVIQSQVVLNGPGQIGSAFVNQNLSTEFYLLATGSRLIDLEFDAYRFWRGALGQNGINAKGSTTFAVQISRVSDSNGIAFPGGATVASTPVMRFAPSLLGSLGGTCVGAGTCSAIAPFMLNGEAEAPNSGGDTYDDFLLNGEVDAGVRTGAFKVSINLPPLLPNPDPTNPINYYKFTITGAAVADAETPVPAPGILALLGIGLLGLGVVRRRGG